MFVVSGLTCTMAFGLTRFEGTSIHSAPALSATSSLPPRHIKTAFMKTKRTGALDTAGRHKNSEEGAGNGGLDDVGAGKGYKSERMQDKIEPEELHDT